LLLDGSLQIIGLYRKDSGVYICTANNGIGRPIQREFQLEVTGKQHTGRQMSCLKCISLPTVCTTCKVVNFNTVHMHEHLTAWGISSMRSIFKAGGNYILTMYSLEHGSRNSVFYYIIAITSPSGNEHT
jgi:hypothetical protein